MVKLLVVDDEEMIRVNLRYFLEDEGFDVHCADSGEGAIALLRTFKTPPDIAIVDMRLPGIDGNETILTAHAIFPQIQFIVHTGSSEYFLGDELRAIGLTDDNVLLKPLANMDAIVKVIANIQAAH